MAGAGREGGAIPVMGAQGEAIPVMGAFSGGLRGVLAPASYGHMWYLRFVGLFVHATYLL